MRYAVWSKDKDCNVFADKRSFKSLSYAKRVCLNVADRLNGDFYVKEIIADNYVSKLEQENKMMRECLGFYASEENWNSKKYRDGALMLFEELGGEKAREVLNKLTKDER
jgi:hypothetical protein